MSALGCIARILAANGTIPTGAPAFDSSAGLVAYYPFDGSAADASGHLRHGVVHGATLAADRFGNLQSAFSFDGIDDFIVADATGLPAAQRTVAFWFRAETDAQPVMVSYGGGSCGTTWFMALNGVTPSSYSSRYYLTCHCDVHTLAHAYSSPPIGRWVHWAATTDSCGTKMYLDGVLVATSPDFIADTDVAGKDLSMGVATGPGGFAPYTDVNVSYLSGALDDIRIYDRALTAIEIGSLAGQGGLVGAEHKISELAGMFGGDLDPADDFGISAAALGDLDGNGVDDIAVGAYQDDDGGVNQGAVWILLLNSDGTVASEQKISAASGAFGGDLDPFDNFGVSVASLGDLDGDGNCDLAVGADGDDDGGSESGAIWILFLQADGTVSAHQKISATAGLLMGSLDPGDHFGASLSSADLDDDGIDDLAVGASQDSDTGAAEGAVWILFLNSDGTVAFEQKINEASGGFTGVLEDQDWLGVSVSVLGDLDANGVPDLAVGALGDDDGGPERGSVWVLFLDVDCTVLTQQKISATSAGFAEALDDGDSFGVAVSALGDLDGDGVMDLAAGADRDDDGGTDRGAVWLMLLNADGTVKTRWKASQTSGGFEGMLAGSDHFGKSIARLDVDGDGGRDLVVGANGDDDGGSEQGAVWILLLEAPDTTPPVLSCPPSVSAVDIKSGSPGEIVSFSVTASDATDPCPTVVCIPPSGSFFPRGTTLVTCTATDASGNESVCTFPVVVTPTIRERRL